MPVRVCLRCVQQLLKSMEHFDAEVLQIFTRATRSAPHDGRKAGFAKVRSWHMLPLPQQPWCTHVLLRLRRCWPWGIIYWHLPESC